MTLHEQPISKRDLTTWSEHKSTKCVDWWTKRTLIKMTVFSRSGTFTLPTCPHRIRMFCFIHDILCSFGFGYLVCIMYCVVFGQIYSTSNGMSYVIVLKASFVLNNTNAASVTGITLSHDQLEYAQVYQ